MTSASVSLDELKRVSVVIPSFRDADRAITLVLALQQQLIAPAISMEVVVVDDGSGDDGPDRMDEAIGSTAKIIRLDRNCGRAMARNVGARQARGDVMIFMDCDCLPLNNSFVSSHLNTLSDGNVASTGHVSGFGDDFWDRYQREASARRARQHNKGFTSAGSSQNLAVSKVAFNKIGGFDTRYRHYGFEDRDLLLRLSELGNIGWVGGSGVQHLDALTMEGVGRKMAEAGEHTSQLFSRRHRAAYEALGYAALDCRLHRCLAGAARLLDHTIQPAMRWADTILRASLVPYFVKRFLVKTLSGASFLAGTSRPCPPG